MAYQFDTLNQMIDEQINQDAIADFMRAPLTGDILEVPGIDRNIKRMLALTPEPIHTTFQLIGKILLLKGYDMHAHQVITCEQHCDRVVKWLRTKGISNGQALTLTLIEKINTLIPGLYDADQFN
jgi:hypothetical protein